MELIRGTLESGNEVMYKGEIYVFIEWVLEPGLNEEYQMEFVVKALVSKVEQALTSNISTCFPISNKEMYQPTRSINWHLSEFAGGLAWGLRNRNNGDHI